MPFIYERTIHFPDTDAAGVVFFANYLSICHEAYEEALAKAGLPVRTFFSEQEIVVPVSKASADFLRPLRCGDRVRIEVRPTLLNENSYMVEYNLTRLGKPDKLAGQARTSHVCISSVNRERAPLPELLRSWINAG